MNNKALTLVEVIISTLLVAILAAGMFSAFIGANYIFNRHRHRIQAFNFAREAMDRLRSEYTYSSNPQMNVGTDKPESDIGTILKGELTDLNAVFEYDVSEPEVNGYKKVEVEIVWEETLESL